MLVVEELYKEAVVNTRRRLIIFNGELDRIRSGCILYRLIFDSIYMILGTYLNFHLHYLLVLKSDPVGIKMIKE